MYFVDAWYCAMFIMGTLQCDLDLLATEKNLPSLFTRFEKFKRPLFYVLLVIAIYLGGCPASTQDLNMLRESPGWYYLSFLKPEAIYDFKWFFLFFAASLTVAAIPRIPALRRFFELRFIQYLGRISFSFYLVHGPIIWTVADRLYAATGCTRASHGKTAARWINMVPLPNVGPVGLEVNFLVPHLLILPITLWLAEITTKIFDQPSLQLSQWLYSKTLESREDF